MLAATKMGPAVVHKQREKSEAISQGQKERASPMVRLEVEDASQEGWIPVCLPPSGFGQVIYLPGSQLSYLQHGSWLRSFEQWQFWNSFNKWGNLNGDPHHFIPGGKLGSHLPRLLFSFCCQQSLPRISILCSVLLFSLKTCFAFT